MAIKIGYSLQTVTKLLKYIQSIDIKNSGWIRLSTTEDNPLTLNDLTDIGNFSASFWVQGPEGLSTAVPINIVVAEKNDRVYQTIFYLSKIFERSYSPDVDVWSGWAQLQSLMDAEFGSTEPANPSNNMVWFNTQSGAPIIQSFKAATREWVDIQPAQLMKFSVYDTEKKCTDVYLYCDSTIKENKLPETFAEYKTHIADETIHITADEREKWNSAQDIVDTDEEVAEFKQQMQERTDQDVTAKHTTNTKQLETIAEATDTIDKHMANETIHPEQSKQSEWINKPDHYHSHYLDGTVTLTSEMIEDVGYGPISSERFNKAALERGISIDDEAALLTLTTEQVQDGDSVYVKATQSSYFVVDSSKLGSKEAFKEFSVHQKELTWSNIKKETIPTTVKGYGITDAYDDESYKGAFEHTMTEATNLTTNATKYKTAVVATGVTQDEINTIGTYQSIVDTTKKDLFTLWDLVINS